jgi:polyhydroxyalkanoate synthesis regulator phasin
MTDEVSNLILEQLRLMRADMAAIRDELKALTERIDTLETEVRGLNYIVTVTIGSLMSEVKDLKSRVSALEHA